MKTIKELMYKAALTFTLVVLAVSPLSKIVAQTQNTPEQPLKFNSIIMFFFMSLCIGATFIIFKIKSMPPLIKRLLHVTASYGITIAFIIPYISGKAKTVIGFFIVTLIFAVVYPLLMLISYLSKVIEDKTSGKENEIDEYKKNLQSKK